MGGIGIILAKNLAGGNDLERRLVFQHVADLHRRGVGAQDHVFKTVQKKRILLVAGRVVLGHVQGGEIVFFQLNFRSGRDLVAKVQKKIFDLALDIGNQVEMSQRDFGRGQGIIVPFVSAAATAAAFFPALRPGFFRRNP